MRRAVVSLLIVICLPLSVRADLSDFLRSCAWGIAIGAAAGTVSLAFENKPSDHTINIARGASLGLYGGIAYGLMQLNPPPSSSVDQFGAWIVPRQNDGRFDGLSAHLLVGRF